MPLRGMDQQDTRSAEEIARDDADATERAKQTKARFDALRKQQLEQLAQMERDAGGAGTPEQKAVEEKKTAAAKTIPLYVPTQLGGKKDEPEQVDIAANPDPITLETLEDEIERQTKLYKEGKPYDSIIVARTAAEVPAIPLADYPKAGDSPAVLAQKAERRVTKSGIKYYDAHAFNLLFFDYQRKTPQGAGGFVGSSQQAEAIGYPIILPWKEPDSWQVRRRRYRDPVFNVPLVSYPKTEIQYYVYDPAAPQKGFQYLCSYEEDYLVTGKLFNNVQGSPWQGYSQDYFLHYFYAHQNFDDKRGATPAELKEGLHVYAAPYKAYKKTALAWLKQYKPATHASPAPAVTRLEPLPFLPVDQKILQGYLAAALTAKENGDFDEAARLLMLIVDAWLDDNEAASRRRTAQITLGDLYATGGPGFRKDTYKAIDFYGDVMRSQRGLEDSPQYKEATAAHARATTDFISGNTGPGGEVMPHDKHAKLLQDGKQLLYRKNYAQAFYDLSNVSTAVTDNDVAATARKAEALQLLGIMHRDGGPDFPKNARFAQVYFAKAAALAQEAKIRLADTLFSEAEVKNIQAQEQATIEQYKKRLVRMDEPRELSDYYINSFLDAQEAWQSLNYRRAKIYINSLMAGGGRTPFDVWLKGEAQKMLDQIDQGKAPAPAPKRTATPPAELKREGAATRGTQPETKRRVSDVGTSTSVDDDDADIARAIEESLKNAAGRPVVAAPAGDITAYLVQLQYELLALSSANR